MVEYEIWGSHKHKKYCLVPATSSHRGDIFGAGKLPYTAMRLALMKLPSDDAAIYMYQCFFEALGVLTEEDRLSLDHKAPAHVGLPVWTSGPYELTPEELERREKMKAECEWLK